MKVSDTSKRLQELMQERGLKQADILRKCQPFCEKYGSRLGRNDLSQYVTGKVIPGQDKLMILAKALGVSEIWLMGYNDGQELKKEIEVFKMLQQTHKADEVYAFAMYTTLHDEDRDRIIERMETIIEKYPDEEKECFTFKPDDGIGST